MYCVICGKEIDDKQFRNTCEICEKKVNRLSKQMLKSRKKINFHLLKNNLKEQPQKCPRG